jgi:hypothetical protein
MSTQGAHFVGLVHLGSTRQQPAYTLNAQNEHLCARSVHLAVSWPLQCARCPRKMGVMWHMEHVAEAAGHTVHLHHVEVTRAGNCAEATVLWFCRGGG